MAHLYLDPELTAAATGPGARHVLVGDEGRHAATVSRVRAGERIAVGDGRGTVVEGEVVAVESDAVRFVVVAVRRHEPARPRIVLAQALAKSGRDELAVQTATELGVDAVVPWSAERSVVRWQGAKRERGRGRWQRIVREATKQAQRAWIPAVAPATGAAGLVDAAPGARVLVLEPTASRRLAGLPLDDRDLLLVVGPEGGVTEAEHAVLARSGAERVRLGEPVLRTSTAGPAAIAVLSAGLGRW